MSAWPMAGYGIAMRCFSSVSRGRVPPASGARPSRVISIHAVWRTLIGVTPRAASRRARAEAAADMVAVVEIDG
jgi:hypothetical protein